MKNMKIAVTAEQPLDEIVMELEKRGYKEDDISSDNPMFVYSGGSGHYFKHKVDIPLTHGDLTTLAELKEMSHE